MILNSATAHGALPVLPTAVLLLATASSWRGRRSWVEAVGLGAGVTLLALLLGGLPIPVFASLLPLAALPLALAILAWTEWTFAPDQGQTGFSWALRAALHPTLITGLGAAAGFWPMLVLSRSPALPLASILATGLGLIVAHTCDRAWGWSPAQSAGRLGRDEPPSLSFPEPTKPC